MDEHRLRCQEAGCTDFLVKPVRKAAITSALARFLGPGKATPPAAGGSGPSDAPDRDRLRPLLPTFFATATDTLAVARLALAAGDLETAGRQGHKLKGSARSYGFADLGLAAETLEQAGQVSDAATAAAALDKAATLLANARKDWV
jgi:HPt (histidine-containing phosphotransfer) domain-containing protein